MDSILRNNIRQHIKKLRAQLPHRQQLKFSHSIVREIFKQEVYRHAKYIALYMPANGEVCLKSLWKTASMHGKYCYFPVLAGETLEFYHATPATKFIENKFGILEPDTKDLEPIKPEKLQIVFMPLVSFDKFGHRLGMGKGYYDKTFSSIPRDSNKKVKFYGVAYECQQYTLLPYEDWDVPLDAIFTEKTIYWT